MQTSTTKWINFIVGFILFIGVIYYLNSHGELTYLFRLNSSFIFILVCINTFILSVQSLITKFSLETLSTKLNKTEIMFLNGVSSAVNMILPLQAGLGFRAFYFNKIHGIKITQFGEIFVLLSLLHIFFSSVTLFTIYVSFSVLGTNNMAIVLSLVVSFFLTYNLIPKFLKLLNYVKSFKFINSKLKLENFVLNNSQLKKILLVETISVIAMFFMLSLILVYLEQEINFIKFFIFTITILVINTVNFTPGNIGLGEWVFGIVSVANGYEMIVGLELMLLLRIVNYFSILILFVSAWMYFSNKGLDIFQK